MPKGYVVVRAEVTDPAKWAEYVAKSKIALEKFGGTPIVRGGKSEVMEGTGRPRNVVLEFPSYEAALGYATSPEYAEAKKARQGAGTMDMTIVEGDLRPPPRQAEHLTSPPGRGEVVPMLPTTPLPAAGER